MSVREAAITAVLDRIDLQLAADSDEVVLTRAEAETLAKALELITNYAHRLELEVAAQFIQRNHDAAPPLSEAQRHALARLLQGGASA